MKVTTNTVYDILIRMRDYFELDNPAKKYTHEEPLRASLLSSDQMEEQGKLVASTHKLTETPGPDQLLKRLADNEKVLLEVRNLLADTIKTSKRITPAGEWLLDNFYLIEEQITIAKKHLPKGYSLSLPRLGNEGSEGLPRVYDIALEIISHSDGRVDLRSLSNFVAAYQTITTLTMGELWAIPIMLRLALIENLRRVAARIALDKIDQNLANYWAEKMMVTVENKPKDLILEIADMARSNPPLDSPFVAELTRRIQGKGPALSMVMTWLEHQLSDTGVTTNELVNFENQKQAADQVSMSNSIGSLRFLGATDWKEFVETLSTVEQVLRGDEAGVYGQMDFYTRDNYRHVIEAISRKSDHSETTIAELVARLAREQALVHGRNDRRAHLGYFLVDKGLHTTQKEAGMKFTRLEKLKRGIGKFPVSAFLWSIAIITVICTAGMMYLANGRELPLYQMIILGVLTALGTSQLAVSVVNWVTTIMVPPKLLPRMDYSKGIAAHSKTLVVIPTMISSPSSVESLTEALEVRYLGNIDDNLSFALLTDFPDADAETLPDDSKLLELAKEKIEELNEKYRKKDRDIFFLFHRPRKWNPREGSWMGEERKRGKLADLNAFLTGHGADKFSVITGDTSHLKDVKYVITLDSDTELPRETAWRMAGAMAHTLNRPVYDEKKQRVVDGYGILQPRAAISLPKTDSSDYTKMHGSDTGLDPYTQVTSDVYQDLFGEGSFVGKGIYEIDAFEKALGNRFPDNRILSHDLLEGCYVRSGLLSDVQLYEEYPSSYMADVKRRHRRIYR